MSKCIQETFKLSTIVVHEFLLGVTYLSALFYSTLSQYSSQTYTLCMYTYKTSSKNTVVFCSVPIFSLFISSKGQETCQQFPPPPEVGWGPSLFTKRAGLVPLSDFTGEVFADDFGKAEIKFGAADKMKIGEMHYSAKLYTGGNTMEEIEDCVVHRVEDGDVIFNVMTPKEGEYVLRLFLKDEAMETNYEFCNYLLLSKQREENGRFPKGYRSRLGPKTAFAYSGLHPTRPSGFIKTEQDQVYIGFSRSEDVELSVNLSGENVKASEAQLLLSQDESGKMVSYTVK